MAKKEKKEEKILKGGLVISNGVAIGDAIIVDNYQLNTPEYELKNNEDIEKEKARYKKAVEDTREELQNLIDTYKGSESKLVVDILDSHLKIIEDEAIITQVYDIIERTKKNAEYSLEVFFKKYFELMENAGNDYFKQRVHDFMDIKNRINSKLMKEEKFSVYDSDKTGIIVAETIPPTETARINRDRILGFVTEMGGATSHSSIIAKGLNIPTIIDIENLLKEVNEGDKLILDAIHGELIINPTEQTLNFYEDIRDHYQKLTESYLAKVNQDTITLDKLRIYVQSNCESADELELIKKTGAEAIGLYRSEFLFIHRDNLPDEQEQFEVYNHVCESLFPKKVTIRTFDLGGDKFVEGVTRYEHNPYLGWRSVRIAIDRKDMFITQLKALLKASRKRNLRIMFPMISGIEELFKCLEILEEAKEILRKEDIEFDENIKVGTMIEVPSAVLIADELAKYVDFFSIGTNDLIQYTLAADRGNKQIAHLYDAYHPAIFRLIKNTVDIAVKHNIEISVCGEVASDPYYVPILVALGIRTLSLSPSSIPEIKEVLSSIKVSDWKELWDNKLSSIYNKNEIKKIIRDKMYKDCPEICELEKF